MIVGDFTGRENVTGEDEMGENRLWTERKATRSQLISPKENAVTGGNEGERCSHCDDITHVSSNMSVLWISCQTFRKSLSSIVIIMSGDEENINTKTYIP